MKLSKRHFCIKYGFEVQWVTSLCLSGIIPFKKEGYNKIKIDESIINSLKEGIHYVSCPNCLKKMASVTKKHLVKCSGENTENIYSELYLQSHKKTEDQKKAQSKKLKARFKAPEGKITRKQIGVASKRFNAGPEFKERKKKKCKEVQNRPEMKELRSKKSKEMWSDSDFRKRHKKYVKENIEVLRESARRARTNLKKTSKLHLSYKERMVEKGLLNFITEYEYGPYAIDEADPLAKIAVEVDGCYWHGCSSCGYEGDKRIKLIDKKKTTYLKNRGWVIIRVKEHEIKKDPYACIEMLKNLQERRRKVNKDKIRASFLKGELKVRSMKNKEPAPSWNQVSNVLRHNTPHKRMIHVITDIGDTTVTEDHSLFLWDTKDPIRTDELKEGIRIIGLPGYEFEPAEIIRIEEAEKEEHTFDLSVPNAENAVLDSGILVHNSYSISGVSLDIEKSSKYQAMKDEYINEYDKLVEANKRSIKIIKGLRQLRYGIGITSALGPLNRPGVQSRRNMISPGYGAYV